VKQAASPLGIRNSDGVSLTKPTNQKTKIMLNKKHLLSLSAAVFACGVFAGNSSAGTYSKPYVALEEEAPASVVSGSLSLQVNTHFISYGLDVWGAGMDWNDVLFNPSIELNFDLGGGFTFILGTWWDVNDNADSDIGGAIQEVDVYAGFSYETGVVTFTVLYQEWMYASQSERIVDLIVGFDAPLSPYVIVHGRVDGEGLDTGIVGVLGGSYDFEVGPVSFGTPVAVAFATDDFHGGSGGFAYTSAGLTASVPVPFLPGDWSLDTAVTYYYTNDSVIPSNPDDSFVTGSIGLSLAF